MKNTRYIDLMEQVLSAYSNEHIERYYNDVRNEGLTEHGFPRLTANIGILIAYGKRTDLIPRFVEMMDLCCKEIPVRKNAANEFSIKEVVWCLMELEEHETFPKEQINNWKEQLKTVTVENCYRVYAERPDSRVFNWAAFAMLSEWMRYYCHLASEDKTFIENQAASQWQWVDENGMYRDPHEPMVYDFVTRGLFAMAIHFGYRGEYFEEWDDALKRSGLLSLKMISVTGELPYGGRSNQFLHNEAHCALILENEAARYARSNDIKTAGTFKAMAQRSLDNIQSWLEKKPVRHIKNAFPLETKYGCEGYAYFDKYMITTASFLYAAFLLSDESILAGEVDDISPESWQSSEHFHKVFLRAGNYFAEYDYRADYRYDASGLGRLHRKNAPGTICLSCPGTDTPNYEINAADAEPFAIVPAVCCDGQWLSGAAPEVLHTVKEHGTQGKSAFARIQCVWPDKAEVESSWSLDENGLKIIVRGKGKVGLMLPAFFFDGRENPRITASEKTLSIRYQDHECIWRLENGSLVDTASMGYNRNGHYKLFRAEGEESLTVAVTID